jgi:hypothetical protein
MAIDRSSDAFLLDAYSGGGGFLSGEYLVKFPRETDANFASRKELAVYPNYTRKVVDIYSGFLWQREPSRESDDAYARFAANADGGGTALNMLMQTYQRLALLLGTVYLIVDKPAGQAQTRAEDKAPYLALRLPEELVSHQADADGRFASCVFSEVVNDETRYRHFDAQGWKVTEDEEGQTIIDQGAYTLGRPPVVRLHSTLPLKPTDIRARPWAHDLAQLNWDLYNQMSELRWLFRSQVFAMLKLPAKSQEERERLTGMVIGPNNAMSYDPSDGGEPGFMAPPADPVEMYQKDIASTIERIYQMANLEFIGAVNASGVALQFQFMQANRAMGIIAANTEQAEREIAVLVSAWQGSDWKGNIVYPRDFNLADLAETLKQAMEAIQLSISPKFDAEVKKRVARQTLGHGVPQATLQAIDGEIEAGGDPYGDRAAREAGNLPALGKTA